MILFFGNPAIHLSIEQVRTRGFASQDFSCFALIGFVNQVERLHCCFENILQKIEAVNNSNKKLRFASSGSGKRR